MENGDKKSLHNINIFHILDIFHFLNSYLVFHTHFEVNKLKSSALSQMPEEEYPQGWVELVALTVSGNHEFLSNNPPGLLTLPFSMIRLCDDYLSFLCLSDPLMGERRSSTLLLYISASRREAVGMSGAHTHSSQWSSLN